MKKIIISFLILSLFTSQTTFSAFFEDSTEKDIEIEYLAENNVIQGRSQGLFEPDALVNRAEMLKILLEAKSISPDLEDYNNCFPDINTQWFAPYVCYAKEKEIIKGYEDGLFKPSKNVNLAEALKMANYNFNIDFDIQGENWYSSLLEGSKNYAITEINNPSQKVSRKEMANLTLKAFLVSLTSQKYSPSSLNYLRKNDIKIDELNKISNLPLDATENSSWILKVKSNDPSRFDIYYPHYDSAIILTEKTEEIISPPTVYIRNKSGFAQLGLNADFVYDASASTEDGVFKADADLSGFYGDSINLEFYPGQKLNIYSDLRKKSLSINLKTGKITGDSSLSQGQSSILDKDFSVCVNDGGEYYGEVKVLSDMKTVLISECPYKVAKEKKKPLIISMYPPLLPPIKEGKRKILPPNPKKPNAPANTTSPGENQELENEPLNIDGPAPVTTDTFEGEGLDDNNPFPEPQNHPGGFESIKTNIAALEAFIEREEQKYEDREGVFNENKEIMAEAIAVIEEMLEENNLKKPDIPNYDPSSCCPTAKKDGKCCSDLDLSKEEDRKTYKKRMQCLINEFNETQKELQEKLDSVNTLSGNISSLQMAEDNLGQLAAFLRVQKIGMHILIDVATGGGDFMEAFLDNAIGELFGEDAEKIYNAAKDPQSVAEGALINEITGYQDKVKEIAGRLADKLKIEGAQKDALVNNLVDKFGGNPGDLANPAAWLKALNDAMVNVGGAAAESFLNTMKKMRAKRDSDLKEAFKLAHLLSQMNEFMNKVATEDCGRKYITEIKKKLANDKKKKAENKARLKADAKYIEDALAWILDNYFDELTSDNPSPDILKERLLKKLKQKLCLYGYDLCWVEISFEVEYEKTENGYAWKIKKYTIKKLDKKKTKDCECEDIFGDSSSRDEKTENQSNSSLDDDLSNTDTENNSDSSVGSNSNQDSDYVCDSCNYEDDFLDSNFVNLSNYSTYMFEASDYSLGEASIYECTDIIIEQKIEEDIMVLNDEETLSFELLNQLFNNKAYLIDEDSKLNTIANSDLFYDHIEFISEQEISIYLNGNIVQTHPCDFIRVETQIIETLRQIYPSQEINIFINNESINSIYFD